MATRCKGDRISMVVVGHIVGKDLGKGGSADGDTPIEKVRSNRSERLHGARKKISCPRIRE